MNVDQVEVTKHARERWLNDIDRPAPTRWSQRKEFLRKVLESTDRDSDQCEREENRLIIQYRGTTFIFQETDQEHNNQFILVTFYSQTSALFVEEIQGERLDRVD